MIIYEIINQIELKNWNLARELWITEIINYDFKITQTRYHYLDLKKKDLYIYILIFLYQRHILIQIKRYIF